MRATVVLSLLVLFVLSVAPSAQAAPPLVVGVSAKAVGSDAATVRGILAPAGRPLVYHVAFRRLGKSWSTSPSRSVKGVRRRTVRVSLTRLRPDTVYAYRLVATRCGGCRSGTRRTPERTFRTAAAPQPVSAPKTATQAASVVAPDPPPALASGAASSPTSGGTQTGLQPTSPTPNDPESPAAYTNPVLPSTFPDPMVLKDGSTYWAYATGPLFRRASSTDLMTWTDRGTALKSRPSWAVNEPEWHPWAPSVIRRDAACPGAASGPCYLMFFSALSDDLGPTRRTNCMAVATSPAPGGEFTDRGILRNGEGVKVGCGDANGYGNIDAHPFIDTNGRAYLYLSTDYACSGGACELRPTMSVMPLKTDLTTVDGPRKELFTGAVSWEFRGGRPVVEGPFVVKRDGIYHMLYSGGAWAANYGMGHATASSPTGTFSRSSDTPFLTSTSTVLDPGGGSLITGPNGGEWLVYHGKSERIGEDNRKLYIDPLTWTRPATRDYDVPVLQGPSSTPVTVKP